MPLTNDISLLTAALELDADDDLVGTCMEVYSEEFLTTGVALSVSTMSHELNFRFTGFGSHINDPVPKAVRSGLLPRVEASVYSAYQSVLRIHYVDRWGANFGTHYGFASAHCSFSSGWPYPMALLAHHSGMPESLRRRTRILERYGIDHVRLVAFDFRSNMVSVCTQPSRRQLAHDSLIRLFEDLDIPIPDTDALHGANEAFALNLTFDWDSSVSARVCLLVIERGRPHISTPPEPLFKTFADHAPFDSPVRYFTHGMSFSPNGCFSMLESLYRPAPGYPWESVAVRRPRWHAEDHGHR